jgi:hypothetical protein
MTREPVCFTVHSLAHVRAALEAGRDSGRPVVILSAAGAGAFAGAEWFLGLIRQAEAAFPDMAFAAILDCGDRGGDVLAALKAGAHQIVFTGHPDAARRLRAIAAETGAEILDMRPSAIDLLNATDPAYAARVAAHRPTGA